MHRSVTALAAVLVVAAGGCVPGTSGPDRSGAPSATSPSTATPSQAAPCNPTAPGVSIAAATFDIRPTTFVRTQAGRYFVTATGFEHGGPFDPPVGRTRVAWGPADRVPTYDPGPATVTGASGQADVVEGEGTWIELPDGEHWFLNSNGAELTIAGCPPATPAAVVTTR